MWVTIVAPLPPMFCVMAVRAPSIWSAPAWPRSCSAVSYTHLTLPTSDLV